MVAFQPIPREKVMAVIERLGPVQPVDVRRELREGDTVLIGAILSEMAAQGLVAITRTKRGGSPFYYDPRKPESLEKAAVALGEKDKRTFDFLRAEGVLREDALEPLTRVSLGNIPDFSRRFVVSLNGVETPFWRYYLLPEQDAKARAVPAQRPAPAAPVVDVPAAAPVVEAAPKKTRKRASAKKGRKTVAESVAQQPLTTPPFDLLLERVSSTLKDVSDVTVIKAETELTCVHKHAGPHGTLHTFVYATTKKLTERTALKWLLAARGAGMPLLILSSEETPTKIAELAEDTPNLHLRRL